MLLAAVADGAGTASLAEVGAELAVRGALERLAQQASKLAGQANETAARNLLRDALSVAKESLLVEADKRKIAVRELATTLILVLATPEQVAAAQVGDGAVVMAADDGVLLALTKPCPAEYLNETVFLTSPDALDRVQIEFRAGGPARLAVLSDGLQMLALKMPMGAPHPPFFSPLLRLVEKGANTELGNEQLAAFLRSTRVGERTDDDLTLVLAAQQ